MSTPNEPIAAPGARALPRRPSPTWQRVTRYVTGRVAILALMVAAGVFVSIVVLNYGGYIDKIFQAQIEDSLLFLSLSMRDATPEQVVEATERARWQMEEAMGLHQPFLSRCARWWWHAVTFDWGETHLTPTFWSMTPRPVGRLLGQTLKNTLLLAGTANLLIFFASIGLALRLAQRHSSLLDRVMVALSPISTIPNWMYGILLTAFFAGTLHLLPFGGMYGQFPPATRLGYVPVVLTHMILPISAIFLSLFFQSVYSWRTFFLVHSGEDYVELAQAQGLPRPMVERRYLLRPVLPYILTSFALMLISFWQGIIVLESLFNWPGIGLLFLRALLINDRAVTVATVVAFALVLAASVLLLDIVYALVDPRLRVSGGEGARQRPIRVRSGLRPRLRLSAMAGAGRAGRGPLGSRAITRQADPGLRSLAEGSGSGVGAADLAGSSPRKPLAQRLRAGSAWLRELARYPSALFGLLLILALVGVSVYTVIAIPYRTAVVRWRDADPGRYQVPATAWPEWVNLFRKHKLPPTLVLNSQDGTAQKEVVPGANGTQAITLTYTFDYLYGAFPQDVSIYFVAPHRVRRPFVTLTWLTPDGRQLDLGAFSVVSGQVWHASDQIPQRLLRDSSQVKGWLRGRGGTPPQQVLLADPASDEPAVLPGRYTLRIAGLTFEPGSTLDAELVLLGQVYGLAGTDDMRRDLMVGLLWGAPVALALGLAGALLTALLSMLIAAVSAWHGGWVDSALQRLVEMNMMLPALPLALMIYYAYSQSMWVILGVVVLLSVLGSAIKNYRAVFLQAKEAPYIEAARAYGAGDGRLIRAYLMPRILPLLVPQLVFLIPTYVFFEATLTFLGVSDPHMPTWGKIIFEALARGAYEGKLFWVLEPTGLIVMTGLAFAMLGFALDAILNPRLRRR